MTNTHLEEQLAGQSEEVQDEIIRINTDARHLSLQVALIVPLVVGFLGIVTAFRMRRLPDPEPSEAAESLLVG